MDTKAPRIIIDTNSSMATTPTAPPLPSSAGAPVSPSAAPCKIIKFGVPLDENCKNGQLPEPLVELLVYIAQEGVTTTDLFRRPGNTNDARIIIKQLSDGVKVNLKSYNFYTLASVVKKFLLRIPGGVFGPKVEGRLLEVMRLTHRMEQYEEIRKTLSSLSAPAQQLLALLFGTWFRIVNHSEYNAMSSEAVAKSVTGSLFHTCSDNVDKINMAAKVMQVLIDDFGVANMFGRSNIQYFADRTRTGIRVQEKFKYEYRPSNRESVSYEQSFSNFEQHLLNESSVHGFDLVENAITESEFYGRGRANTKSSSHSRDSSDFHAAGGVSVEASGSRTSAPPSPQSLQPPNNYQHVEENTHKKLTHVSSLSAPEVNQGCSNGETPGTPGSHRMFPSNSMSRCDHVRRRQLIRMKKRSNWFLAPTPNTSAVSSTSRSSSPCGRSSLDGRRASSDIHMSDIEGDATAHNVSLGASHVMPPGPATPPSLAVNLVSTSTPADGSMAAATMPRGSGRHSPYGAHGGRAAPLQNDLSSISNTTNNRSYLSPYTASSSHSAMDQASSVSGNSLSSSSSALTPSPCGYTASQSASTIHQQPQSQLHPHQPPILSSPDYLNGNHHHDGLASSPNNSKRSSASPMVTERDVRYFMVENWYGSPMTGKNDSVTPSTGS